VYAVTSTRVFCRPGCPSRRPLQRNVRFFASPEQARAAGFRPCLRCRPERAAPPDPARAKLIEVAQRIARAPQPLTLAQLAGAARRSPHHLQRRFKALFGISPRQCAEAIRSQRIKRRLRSGEPIAAALYAAGFGSSSRLYERAAAELGMTPARYQAGGRGESIGFAVAECALGWLLVAGTERGVCRVALGRAEPVLIDELRREFPHAERERSAQAGAWLEALLASLDGPVDLHELPLDLRATAFERRVFEALRRIPRGETRSYVEVARALGDPRAQRAVAGACARNPVPLLIPCHRVVRADGETGGYRFGTRLKQRLLAREAAGQPRGRGKRAQ
jgi:AraC family transcriptional regulator of adaptative response/methylated-DNA-[protein]-cysteine methyltransferase